MKALQVTMPDGSKWNVPAMAIANHRAEYYAQQFANDHPGAPQNVREQAFRDERNYAMDHTGELVEWAENNMNWEDVKDRATQAEPPNKVDYQEGWINGFKDIVEVE